MPFTVLYLSHEFNDTDRIPLLLIRYHHGQTQHMEMRSHMCLGSR